MVSSSLTARLDAYLEPFTESCDYSGFLVLARGEDETTRAYGHANVEFEVAHTGDTQYWAGSIAKLFTRAALLSISRDGTVALDDTLHRYLPDFPDSDRISLAQLLCHTAGISRDLFLGAEQTVPHTPQEQVELIARLPAVSAPGERELYSNNGYRILARVLEIAAHQPYDAVVRDTVFTPLGMRSTVQPDLLDVVPKLATGYLPGRGYGTLRRAPFYNVVNEQGAGSFYTTPTDLLAFCRALPLEPSEAPPAPPVTAQGEWRPPVSIGHNGLGNGFASYCYRFPEQDACLVMLANIETGLFGRLNDDLTRMLFDQPVSPPPAGPAAVPFDPVAAERVVGDYDFLPGSPLTVRATSEGLELSAGGGFHPLIPIDDDRYFLRLKFAEVAFRPEGPDPALEWSQDGQTYTLRRIGPA